MGVVARGLTDVDPPKGFVVTAGVDGPAPKELALENGLEATGAAADLSQHGEDYSESIHLAENSIHRYCIFCLEQRC